MPSVDMLPLPCACATTRRASRAITQLYDSWLRPHGIEAPQFAILALLDSGGPANQGTIAAQLDLDKTTFSRNVKWLEKQHWIRLAPGEDRRERRVTVTSAGRSRLSAARPAWKQAQTELRNALGSTQWTAVIATLDAVAAAARSARRGGLA